MKKDKNQQTNEINNKKVGYETATDCSNQIDTNEAIDPENNDKNLNQEPKDCK